MLQYKLAMSFRQEDLIRPKMSAKLETLHAPLIAELTRGRKIRWRLSHSEIRIEENMGYVCESNHCSCRCIRNDTTEIKTVVEWYRDWDKNSEIAEKYHLIFSKDPLKRSWSKESFCHKTSRNVTTDLRSFQCATPT